MGVSDHTAAYYDPKGLDLDSIERHVATSGGVLAGWSNQLTIDPAEMIEQPCDILVPAAVEQVITGDNAARIKCRILAEGANGPTTPEADRILDQRREEVFIIPDILANAGGVTTSYFEWVQDRQGYFWKESVVNEHLEDIMITAFDDVVRYSETHGVNNRIAAYMLAIDRVAYTIRQRGIYA